MPIPGGERIPYPVIWKTGQATSPVIPPQQGMTLAGVYLPVAGGAMTLTGTPDPVGKLFYDGVQFGVLPYLPVVDANNVAVGIAGVAGYQILNPQSTWSLMWFKLAGTAPGADLKVVLIFAPII